MTKHLLASLALITACGSSARTTTTPVPANAVPVATYTLLPIPLGGGYSHHSTVQSNTTVTGALTMRGAEATFELVADTFTTYVYYPPEMGQPSPPRDAKPHHSLYKPTLRGTSTPDGTGFTLALRDEKGATMMLRCADTYLGLDCKVADTNMFEGPGDAPYAFAFMPPGTKRFDLTPVDVKNLGRVTGSLAIDPSGAATFELSIDGAAPKTLVAKTTYLADATSFYGESGPLAICRRDGDRLTCELTIARGSGLQYQEFTAKADYVPMGRGVAPPSTQVPQAAISSR